MNQISQKEILPLSDSELFKTLSTSIDGLSEVEAKKRLLEYGPNKLTDHQLNVLVVFGRQFKTSLVYLLIIASLISLWLKDYLNSSIIAIILIINTFLGFYQEYKSEKIVEKLSKIIKRQVVVKRDGRNLLIDELDIVPGDLMTIRKGDIVTADLRLIESTDLEIDESQLTGESLPVLKKSSESDAARLVFSGSTIEKGEGLGIVYATGNNTELGLIAVLSETTKKETPYEKSIKSFSGFLIKIVLGGLGLTFILKLIAVGFSNVTELFLFIVALAVAVVPEALPVIATVTMSKGAIELAKKHAVVKRLSSIEDFGNITLLCTDKTGTLTENKMTITDASSDDEYLLLKFAYASIEPIEHKKRSVINSYDEAFVRYVSEDIKNESANFKIIREWSFDPELRRKRVALENLSSHKKYLISLGSPETLLQFSQTDKKETYRNGLISEGKNGLRHFGLAYKELSDNADLNTITDTDNMLFLGYVTLVDPLRPTAKKAIEDAEKLGIKIKILTGDSKEVAEYVGKEVGLLTSGQIVYIGDELDKMDDEKFQETVNKNNIFARVSPGQKYRIIEALKQNNVLAYQGDGINDAPSLKLADVSIAVEGATDVAKENADVVLLSRNLEVVINGIKYGRTIFVNINKYIKYTMVGNFGNFIALSALFLLSSTLPLPPIQILLVSLFTDIPLISVSNDTVEEKEIIQPSKHNPRELIFTSLLLGIPTAIFELAYFGIIHNNPWSATGLFLFLSFVQLTAFFSIRTIKHFWRGSKPAPLVIVLFSAAFLSSIAITYFTPFNVWFKFSSLNTYSMMIIFIMTLAYLFVIDTVKTRYYRFRKTELRPAN